MLLRLEIEYMSYQEIEFGSRVHPHWNTICFFPFFPFPFPVPSASSVDASAAGVLLPAPHVYPGALLFCCRMTPAPVYPGLKTVLVGFFAAGKAGKASLLPMFTDDCTRLGVGDGRAEFEAELELDVAVPAAGRRESQPEPDC